MIYSSEDHCGLKKEKKSHPKNHSFRKLKRFPTKPKVTRNNERNT